MLAGLLAPPELYFGTWIRPMSLDDLRRFSIPVGIQLGIETSSLYGGAGSRRTLYSRDQWGLRGNYRSLAEIDVLTVGGSTTDQRYLDDMATWQSVAERELRRLGRPLVFANAGVDGQSTAGTLFDFEYWFPRLPHLQPRIVLFYVGINDVMRTPQRARFDRQLDLSWRVKSAVYQLLRTTQGSLRSRETRVGSRRRVLGPRDFTGQGLLDEAGRRTVGQELIAQFLANIEQLRQDAAGLGAQPVFMTQTAWAWNADRSPPRGVNQTLEVFGRTVNYADIADLHQRLNDALMAYCASRDGVCFDLANEVAFSAADYYDYMHNTPAGAAKIGRYLAARFAAGTDATRLDLTR